MITKLERDQLQFGQKMDSIGIAGIYIIPMDIQWIAMHGYQDKNFYKWKLILYIKGFCDQ